MANNLKIDGSFDSNVPDPDDFRYSPPPEYGYQGTYKLVIGEFETVDLIWSDIPIATYPGFIDALWWRVYNTEGKRVVCFIPPLGTPPYRPVWGVPHYPVYTMRAGKVSLTLTVTHVSGNA